MPDNAAVAGRLVSLLDRAPELREQLEVALGFTADQMASVLRGQASLALDDLVTAADVLDVPTAYLTGRADTDASLAVSLRLGQAQRSGAPEEALRYGSMLVKYLALLDLWQGAEESSLNGLGADYSPLYTEAGQRTAGKVRAVLGLGDRPLNDLVSLVESCGVPVAFQPLPKPLSGINLRDNQGGRVRRAIIVNSKDYWTRQRYTLAHELCHSLYDDSGQVIVDEVEVPETLPELRAESFARHLLLPKSYLSAELSRARKSRDKPANVVAHIMVSCGVSRDVVLNALVADGHIAKDDTRLPVLRQARVDTLMQNAGLSADWDLLCDGQDEPSGSPWLVNRAVRAYGDGIIDVSVVAELLGKDTDSTLVALSEAGWTSR